MFNFEQLNVDSSFALLESGTSLTKVKKLLERHRFVVLDSTLVYVIAQNEDKQLEGHDPDMSVGEWVRAVSWPASIKCSLARLSELRTSWERPIVASEEPSGIAGIVTAERIIECLLNERRQLLSYLDTFVETVNDAVTVVDRDGRVIYWNRTAEQVYGIEKADIVGKKIGEHFAKDSIMLHRILDEGRAVRQIYHQPAPDTHVLISASPIVDENRIIGGIATEQDITRIVRLNEELYSSLPAKIEPDDPFASIIGMGHAFRQSLEVARKFADFSTPVLLIGESGSGKEMLAQAIHYNGERKAGAFVTVRCGAIPGGLLESELFGYAGGAFTNDEENGKVGKLQLADGGTVLLEEIGLMPLDIQLKLARYLKSKTFYRIGGEEPVQADARIIATTQIPLQPIMEQGLFLDELYYQLQAMSITIPPLRERTEDIPELVHAFIREFTEQYRKPVPKVDPEAMTALMNYDWPGNVRELRNVVERVVILCDGETVTARQLPQGLMAKVLNESMAQEEELVLKSRLAGQMEEAVIAEALRKAYGNKSAAAKMLGISRGTLYNKMREYDMKV